MSKMNLKRVFLGGLLAGVVIIVLGFASYFVYLGDAWKPTMESLGYPMQETAWMYIFSIIGSFVVGILAIWLYAAIRPRFGGSPRTALLTGFIFWILSGLLPYLSFGSTGMFPADLLILDSLTYLVIMIIATFLGAWIYQEPSP
jgi:magnesium-transporting ATPase (P-type)